MTKNENAVALAKLRKPMTSQQAKELVSKRWAKKDARKIQSEKLKRYWENEKLTHSRISERE